ncbi:MAG: FAD-dependent oxidoreductase [Candidatus Brocadiia bacterium]
MRTCLVSLLVLVLSLPALAGAPAVSESARELPVAYRVDVAVVGGSTGAVAAAVAAAEEGASVFLAAPRPYLGEDTAGTLRLWLEPGEEPTSPLATAIFVEGGGTRPTPIPNALSFTYEADLPSSQPHPDTRPPSRLRDGKWSDAAGESVQYDGDVSLVADLGKTRPVAKAHAMVYHSKDFLFDRVTVSASDDGKSWRKLGEATNERPSLGSDHSAALQMTVEAGVEARYLKFHIQRREGSTRVLVGELAVQGPTGEAEAAPRERPPVPPATPLQVKRALDQALLDADVEFLYSCYATDVLRDAEGRPCGIAMANRAGRQAVVAKVVVDATDRAWVARLAGADFQPYSAGTHTFQRVVVGGEMQSAEGMEAREIKPPYAGRRGGGAYRIFEYTLQIPMRDGSYRSFAHAEQVARDKTYHPDQQFTSDVLFEVPPDPMRGAASAQGPWRGVEALPLEAFRPAGVPRLWVLGGCADISREQAGELLRPLALIDMGTRLGAAVAAEAKALPEPQGVKLPGGDVAPVAQGEVREVLRGVRPVQDLPSVPQEERPLPVLGRYDVVVIGGGTGGAPAGIAAARQGARTLVVEYLHGLGGVGTLGAISKYYWGNRVGFTKDVPGGGSWQIEQKMEWWRRQLRDAGGELWFGTLGCGAFVDGDQVRGAIVATPERRGVVLAKVVVDSTGNADIAAAAGAPCIYTDASDVALQGTGLPPRYLGASYTNTDFTIVDETDMRDVWHVFVYAKVKARNAFDIGQLIDTRERRRIVGDFTISILDQLNRRTYPDTVVRTRSNFDTHGYTVADLFYLRQPDKKGVETRIPYRAMLPRGLDGILVTGLAISAKRDAVPLIRMQPDIQNGGYAAGVAAAKAARRGGNTREVDIQALQKHLVEVGNLPESVVDAEDSYPMSRERIAEAVENVKEDFKDISVVLAHSEQAFPLLKEAYRKASPQDKLPYAQVLAIMGDPTGLPTLVDAVKSFDGLDKGWNYRGMGQFGRNMSELDSLLVALARPGDRRVTPVVLEKLELLEPAHAFSHFRAMALALESLADPRAAEPLARLLAQPAVRGQAVQEVDQAVERERRGSSWTAVAPRREALRELLLARALFRCGDHNGLGRKVLEEYTKDLRGHLARHAQAVLEQGKSR